MYSKIIVKYSDNADKNKKMIEYLTSQGASKVFEDSEGSEFEPNSNAGDLEDLSLALEEKFPSSYADYSDGEDDEEDSIESLYIWV